MSLLTNMGFNMDLSQYSSLVTRKKPIKDRFIYRAATLISYNEYPALPDHLSTVHPHLVTGMKLENYYFFTFTFSRPEVRKLLLFYVFTFSRPEVRKLLLFYFYFFSTWS